MPYPFANLYYPFPFQKRLKITAARAGGFPFGSPFAWYQYTYQKYPSGTRVESWGGPQIDSETTRGLLARVGNDPQDTAGDRVTATRVSVPRGEKVPLLDRKGEGSIRSMRLVMDPWTPDTFHHVNIRMSWDDHPAAVDMPIGVFFGGGGDAIGAADVSTRKLKTEFFGYDGTSGEFYS